VKRAPDRLLDLASMSQFVNYMDRTISLKRNLVIDKESSDVSFTVFRNYPLFFSKILVLEHVVLCYRI